MSGLPGRPLFLLLPDSETRSDLHVSKRKDEKSVESLQRFDPPSLGVGDLQSGTSNLGRQ